MGLTVAQAYAIDKKIDDGQPQTGGVTAMYINQPIPVNTSVAWAAGGSNLNQGAESNTYGPSTAATPSSSTTCYDNGGSSGATQQYSVEISNGSNVNCALSFRFQ